jgi:hypothetical protein
VEKTGTIEIRVNGYHGSLELTPESYDIRELKDLIGHVEDLLFPSERKERPTIAYRVEEGSVRHLFTTSMQAVIAFNAVLGQVKAQNSIDFLEARTAAAIEAIQQESIKKGWSFSLSTNLPGTSEVRIDQNSLFQRTDDVWAEVEMYLYGKVTNAGGKEKANIHIAVEDKGTFLVQTPQSVLAGWETNILYKQYGLRVIGRQNMSTGEVDRTSLQFLELIDHHSRFDKAYLVQLRKKAGSWLKGIDPDSWLNDIRGNDA